ncbi:DMT family transporter [Oceanibium sediminis]|uniref:DMT family transporter n=1 Tax=Oceanibium sediminis TaxID=2026339 RepID=UPI001E62F269|nr:DMT family transporter [Oceanibium sediminis]
MSKSLADNLRGASFMVTAMAGFALNDVAMKAVLADVDLFPALFLRGALTCVLLFALCVATGALRWRPARRDGVLVGWRTLAEILATTLFLTALANMPIANATAILQSAPLAVTLGAALFLAEPVGWRRGLALLVGFSGVLIIIRPGGDAFNAYSLLPLAAVVAIVLRDLVTSRLSGQVPSLAVALMTALAITTLGGIGSLWSDWPPLDARLLGLLSFAAVWLILAYVFSVRTMRVGDIAFVSPFRYSILLWALILGAVVFKEIPDAATILGATLIVATGIFTFWREQALSRRAAMKQSTR